MNLPVNIPVYVALGSNLGESRNTLKEAAAQLDSLPQTRLLRLSSLYRTEPIACSAAAPDFINAVALIQTGLSPLELLAALHALEAQAGRIRTAPNAPRPLDLDILLYANQQIRSPALTLPHPRMHLRAFVLVPLAEIAPENLVLPGRGRLSAWLPATASQRVERLSSKPGGW